jgi:dihydroorotase
MDILIKKGHIIDPSRNIDIQGDLLVSDGKIKTIQSEISASENVRVIDCAGKVVCPGLIDVHVHLRVPGQEYKEDIASGTAAAAAGGFTAVACQPNTVPPIDSAGIVRQILGDAASASARVHVIAAVSPGLQHNELSEMADLQASGAVAVGDDAFPVKDTGFLRRAMEYANMLGLSYVAHCEDKSLTGDGVMNEGYVSSTLGLKGIPRWAENIGTARNILVAMETGCHLHIQHVSTKESVDIIRFFKEKGAPITAETCPQYFCASDADCEGYDTNAKISPPLRTVDDQKAVINGLKEGVLDIIATDHAPHAEHEKAKEFALAPFGMIGLETSLGLCITHLVETGVLTLSQLIEKMSTAPAKSLGVAGGSLGIGDVADITVFDPKEKWMVDPSLFKSKSQNTIFAGKELTGKPVFTILGGVVIGL